MFFYPEDALRAAGAELKIAPPGQGHVEVDRELITGQNPNSDKELAEKFLQALNRQNSAR
jgi:putative intracellular protease/amidase